MVQLATGMKMITSMVENCCFEMNGLQTKANLDVIPLGSYDILIGMDWLDSHFAILDCHNKTIASLDEDGNPTQVKGPEVLRF